MRRVDARVGKEGIIRWMYDGFVFGERIRARDFAAVVRLLDTRARMVGKSVVRDVNGGLVSRRERDCGERVEALVRNAGRRWRRWIRSGGSCWVCCGCDG